MRKATPRSSTAITIGGLICSLFRVQRRTGQHPQTIRAAIKNGITRGTRYFIPRYTPAMIPIFFHTILFFSIASTGHPPHSFLQKSFTIVFAKEENLPCYIHPNVRHTFLDISPKNSENAGFSGSVSNSICFSVLG